MMLRSAHQLHLVQQVDFASTGPIQVPLVENGSPFKPGKFSKGIRGWGGGRDGII